MEVRRIFVACEQFANDRERLARRQALRAARELAARLNVTLAPRERHQGRTRLGADALAVTEEAHGPAADVFTCMTERGAKLPFVEFSAEIQHPERLERSRVIFRQHRAQGRR